MVDKPFANRTKAIDMMAGSSSTVNMSTKDKTALQDALVQDLDTASHKAESEKARFEKIERKMDALSDAVIVMAEHSNAMDDISTHKAESEDARLEKIEGQVHALSDAVIVIAEHSDAVDGAVKTVKDKM